MLRKTVVVDDEFSLGVDRVLAVLERELEHLRFGDRLGRAGLDTQVAVDAPQVVDLVDEAVALTRRDGIVDRVVGAAHVDAVGRANTGAKLAADALLHAVFVTVEDVAAVHTHRLVTLFVVVAAALVLTGHPVVKELAERHLEAIKAREDSHQSTPSPARRLR